MSADGVVARLEAVLELFEVTAVLAVDDLDRDSTLDSEVEAGRIERGEVDLGPVLALPGVSALLGERGIEQDDEEQVRGVIAEALRAGEVSLGPPTEASEGVTSAFAALEGLLEQVGVPFEVRHFDEWNGPDDVTATTLVLFDFRNGETTAGARLAVDYAAARGTDARVAILSQEPGEERDLWAEHLVAEDAERAHQIAWVPKATLTAAPDAIVEQIAVALCAPVLRDLRTRSLGSLQLALDDTEQVTAALSPYGLHRITVGAAVDDGGFEPESLVNRYSRRSVPLAMAQMQLNDAVHQSIRRLRSVQESHILSTDITGTLVAMQRDDYYIDRSLLIGRNQGLVPGDIFAMVDPEIVAATHGGEFEPGTDPLGDALGDLSTLDLCILVAQPCDLAVRADGQRAAPGRTLEALPIETAAGSNRTAIGHAISSNKHIFRLPWLAGGADTPHRQATYKTPLALPTLAVDACTWSMADAAALVLAGTATDRCSMNWQRRYERAIAEAREIEEACAVAGTLGPEQKDLAERIMMHAAASNKAIGFRYTEDGRVLAWGLVRVARLRSPFVESLLTTYNDFRRRDAFPASLA